MQITCPTCGTRDSGEFTYWGDATVKRPAPETASQQDWCDYVYLRDNPMGPHRECWQHVQGCRQFLLVERDTETHAIGRVEPAGPWAAQPKAEPVSQPEAEPVK